MDYQDELKKVDDVCKNAYDAIKNYNKAYESSYSNKSGAQIIEEVRQSIETTKTYYQQMTEYKIAYNSVTVEAVEIDRNIKKKFEREKYNKDDTVIDKLDKVKRAIDATLGINPEYNVDFLDFS